MNQFVSQAYFREPLARLNKHQFEPLEEFLGLSLVHCLLTSSCFTCQDCRRKDKGRSNETAQVYYKGVRILVNHGRGVGAGGVTLCLHFACVSEWRQRWKRTPRRNAHSACPFGSSFQVAQRQGKDFFSSTQKCRLVARPFSPTPLALSTTGM